MRSIKQPQVADDLKSRLSSRVQLTTGGLKVYLEAVEGAFGAEVDYAQLVKIYGASQEETRCSPAECLGCERKVVTGRPDPKHIFTSFVERQNLTMRMGMRRFTRLTNAFSNKVDNHAYQVALHFMHYNFCRIHKTLRVTPAMEAGVADHAWTIEEMLDKVGLYKNRRASLDPVVRGDMAKKRGKLLVIEDHKQLRFALVSLLESLDYEVTAAEDEKEGLNKAREIRPDLVLCDLKLTGLPCLDILKALSVELPQTKVIVTGTETTCEEGHRFGACFCLSHPIAVSDLKAALKHCLGHSFP